MSLSATFTRIAEDETRSAHDRLVDAVTAYKTDHPEASELQAQKAVFTALPNLANEYIDAV